MKLESLTEFNSETPLYKITQERSARAVDGIEDAEFVDTDPETGEESSETKEIDLTTVEGFEAFSSEAEAVYAEAIEYEAQAMAEGYVSVDTTDVPGDEIFDTLDSTLSQLKESIDAGRYETLEAGEEISDAEFDKMQVLYNDLLKLRDHVISTYNPDITGEIIEPEQFVTLEVNQEEETIEGSLVGENIELVPSEATETELESPLDHKDVVTRVDELAASTKKTRSDLLSLFPNKIRTEEIQEDLDEVTNLLHRSEYIQKQVTDTVNSSEDEAILATKLDKYNKVASEIELSAIGYDETLRTKLQEMNVVEEVPTSAEVAREKKVKPVETLKEENELPTEAEVSLLLKQFSVKQFYTKQERETVDVMREVYERSVANESPQAEVLKKYSNLREFIDNLELHPDVDLLTQKGDIVIERVKVASDKELVETATTMNEVLQRIDKDSDKTDERLLQAYRNLENFANDNEEAWLSVCGMKIPTAGPDGAIGASSFREGLMIDRDRHKELQANPEKKMLVDKLIRKVSNVTKEGLDVEEIEEIADLARRINVPSKLIGNLYRPESEPVVEDNTDESDKKTSTVKPVVSRKTMQVEADTDEGTIEIKVARKAQESILEEEVVEDLKSSDVNIAETATMIVPDDFEAEQAAIAEIETNDPINTIVPEDGPTVRSWEERREAGLLVPSENFSEEDLNFIKSAFDSLVDFDRMVRQEVSAHERKTTDLLEGWLGVKHISAFGFLSKLSIEEMSNIASEYDSSLREDFLSKYNFKYDAFTSWEDLIPEMSRLVDIDSVETFGELYTKWILEQTKR